MALEKAPSPAKPEPPRREPGKYETGDVSLRWMTVGLVLLIAGAVVMHWSLWKVWAAQSEEGRSADVPRSVAAEGVRRTGPALQPSVGHDRLPPEDLATMRAGEDAVFAAMGWRAADGKIRVPDEVVGKVVDLERSRPSAPATEATSRSSVGQVTPIPGVDEGGGR